MGRVWSYLLLPQYFYYARGWHILSNVGYDQIQQAWEEEKNNEKLQNLEDLKLSKMSGYLSKVREQLAKTPSENKIQVDLFQEEGVSIEFMLKDLLMLRRQKILNAILSNEQQRGNMTLAEEDFYNRIKKGVEEHLRFVDEAITGKPTPTMTRSDDSETVQPKEDLGESTVEYVMVRFLEPVEEPFVGLDEVVYGPFQKEDIATIPIANARKWLSDGIVVRVVLSTTDEDE
jgi:DNA replication initiation complex subunit (GINS family)